ncbi:hypothetical protein OB905_02595 [Halobacteria archaeon AArc-dxtr1]|nr:hypothetical protein [Halobacteria archaeon AArc-dxtr1]
MAATHARESATAPAERDRGLSQDSAFELLSCRRRRQIIHCLKQHGSPLALRDLVEHVAAWENDVPVGAADYDQRMRVYTALRQSHLPKLDDGGVVRFDADRGIVELTDAASELDVYLDVVPHDDIPWSTYYVGLGFVCFGFVTGIWAGIVPFSFVPPTAGAFLVTGLFTVSAVAHVRYDRQMRLGTNGALPNNDGGA